MNKFLFVVFSMIGILVYGQNINMQDGTFTQCSGVFYDSGGPAGDYANGESKIITFCPDSPGNKIQIDFTSFNVEAGQDYLEVFDGDSNMAPSIGFFSGPNLPSAIRATASNATGCLTFQFFSNNSIRSTGWAANISCFTPCQTILAQLDSTTPAPNADGYIRVCPEEDITLVGSGLFSVDGTGATYEWDLGDGRTISGQNATFSYPNPGVYIANLNIRDNNTTTYASGCPNTNLINQVIQVDTDPDFTGTAAAQSTICYGDTTTIEGVVTTTSWTENCTPPVSGVTFLPDGNGVSYETTLTVECYGATQVLTDINQLESICITMEHSFLGDLAIDIIAPNGNTVRILNYPNSGNSANLGIPWATGTYDNNTSNTTPGVGSQYCFVPGNAYPTLEGGIQFGGVFPLGDGPGTYNDTYVPAGNYRSINPLDALVGTQLNGDWTVRVTDNFPGDNGYIFSWELNFDPSIIPADRSFTPVVTSETWDADASIINTNGSEITVQPTNSGSNCYTYRIVDDFGCEYTTQVCIDVLPEIITAPANDLFTCNVGAPYIFDLTQNTATILANASIPSDLVVTYHQTQANANSDTNSISPANAYSGLDGQTIYARIEYKTSGCYEVETFNLNLTAPPVVNAALDMATCDDSSNDGFQPFDLESQTLTILGTQVPADFKVSYYTSLANAESRTNPLVSPYTNTVNPQPIFVRVERATESTCYSTSGTALFNLNVNYRAIANAPGNYEVCDDVTNDGIESFDLTSLESAILGSQDPSMFSVSYYNDQTDADSGSNPILNPTNFTNTISPQTVYVRVEENANPSCHGLNSFELVVNPMPSIGAPTPLRTCDDSNIDGITQFNLTSKNNGITLGDPNLTVSYYETNLDAQMQTNAIVDPSAFTNSIANSQTLFIRVTNILTGCVNFTALTLIVMPNPTVNSDPNDLITCDDNNPGDLQEVFDLTFNEAYIINGQINVTPSYHLTQLDAEDGTNALTNVNSYTNTSTPQPIFVRVTDDITGCYTVVSFDLIVSPAPQLSSITDFVVCEDNSTGFYAFDLESKTNEVLNGQDLLLYNVTYHETQADADNLTNPILSPYTNATNPQTIYVAISNGLSGCSVSGASFDIEVQEIPEANGDTVPIIYTVCDNSGINDGFAKFDLASMNPDILDGQNPANFAVSYYASFSDADLGINPIPLTYQNINNPQTIYARVDDNSTSNSMCYAIADLNLFVELLPVFDLEDSYILCASTNGTEVIGPPILDTGLSTSNYSFEWSLNGTVIFSETDSSLIPFQGGIYTVVVTNNTTLCQNQDSAEVIESTTPVITAKVTTNAFSDNNVIEASATGGGDYEFSLDFGAWQDDGTFENVLGGEHTITARDKIGCGYSSITVTVIDYPAYFTPNGDSFNDTWNVQGLGSQYNALVYIYDRFGKLLKQISASGDGWNGTYNGALMPSSDYWFTVIFEEPSTGQQKEFRSHFSLKR